MYLIFDTETTGFPLDWNAPLTDFNNWPRCVQLAWQIHDIKGDLVEVKNFIIKPDGFDIPYNAEKIHGISTDRANKIGVSIDKVLKEFVNDVKNSSYIVGHNISFDNNIVGCELLRLNLDNILPSFPSLDTKDLSTDFCKLPGRGGKYKWPNLSELHIKLFGNSFDEAHNAAADVEATTRCFLELIRLSVIPHDQVGMSDDDFSVFKDNNKEPIKLIGLNIQPYGSESIEDDVINNKENLENPDKSSKISKDISFAHLHTHSQFSILQSTNDIIHLVDKAAKDNMSAVAITDHSNMFGAFKLIEAVKNHPINKEKTSLKAIIGCELNVCKDHTDKKTKKIQEIQSHSYV